MPNNLDTIEKVLVDEINHHSTLASYVILFIAAFVLFVYILKKMPLWAAIVIDLSLVVVEFVSFSNRARIDEWSAYYVSKELHEYALSFGHLSLAIMAAVLVIMLVEVCIYLYHKRLKKE